MSDNVSDITSDITDVSEIPPSTTTISTVAVQAGKSRVVLAILRVSKTCKQMLNFLLCAMIGFYNWKEKYDDEKNRKIPENK